jgi:hypothetical protein
MQEKPFRKREALPSSGRVTTFDALPKVVTEVVTTYSGKTWSEQGKIIYIQNDFID